MKNHNLIFRIGADILLFVSVIVFPWWVSLVLGISFVIVFRSYWEIIPLFMLIDCLYGYAGARVLSIPYLYTVIGILVYGLHRIIRGRLSFYK